MKDISVKYSLLNQSAKKEVNDFMDFLLNKQKSKKTTPLSTYKKKILQVSTWSESDVKILKGYRALI
jgi:hypothetical protein